MPDDAYSSEMECKRNSLESNKRLGGSSNARVNGEFRTVTFFYCFPDTFDPRGKR